MKSTTQNAKIAAITEKTLIIGIDVGSETHFARAFNWRGYEFSRHLAIRIRRFSGDVLLDLCMNGLLSG